MLQFIKRGPKEIQPIGDLPLWLSALLRARGVDTAEKAERFLHPDVSHLHDPFLMQGMDKAVRLLEDADSTMKRAHEPARETKAEKEDT